MATTTVKEVDLASTFLTTLGAPDTPLMRRAVVAWMRKESGRTIIGNNPWNMRPGAAAESGVPTCGTRTSTKGNGQFAIFCNPNDGAKAAAKLLLNAGSDWRHYDAIVLGARSGSPTKFFQGLVKSQWSGNSHYGGSTASLVSVYNTVDGVGGNDILGTATPDNPITGQPGAPSGTTGDGSLCAWASGSDPGVCFNVGHTITSADVNTIMTYLKSHGFFAGDDPMGTAEQVVRGILQKQADSGSKWSPDFLAFIAKSSGIASTSATVDPVAMALGGLGSIFGKAIGFAGGLVFIILGVFLYSKSVRSRVVQETT